MSQALSADNYVYEGLWTNWSRNSVFGLTLTLSPYHGSILSLALVVLINLAGTRLWTLIQYALHQLRATTDARPVIYHQLQVLLRSPATDLDTLWRLIHLGIAWRQLLPVVPLALWSLLHFGSILTFSLFSSWLLETNDQVLTISPWCGTWNKTYLSTVNTTNYDDANGRKLAIELRAYTNSRFSLVQHHVDLCADSQRGCQTNVYRPDKLHWNWSYVADECPFQPSACHPDAGTMVFDTGFLSSHSDLGLNAAKEDRVSFRILSKCAPLDSTRYSSLWKNVSTSGGTRQLADASYGQTAHNDRNATYSLWYRPLDCEQRLISVPYALSAYTASPGSSVAGLTGTFDPIPELQLSDAQLSLILLSSDGAFFNPVKDPWFSAQQASNGTFPFCGHTNHTIYTRERPLTAMACTQQWQICNSDKQDVGNASCTPPLERGQTGDLFLSQKSGVSLSARQYVAMRRILTAGAQNSFYYLVFSLSEMGSWPLKARALTDNFAGAVSDDLPPDQWQTETKYWMEMLLAKFQQNSLDLSTGQFVASTSYINVSKPSVNHSDAIQDAQYSLCQTQIIHSQTHRNFNFCALLITLILCVVIIISGFSLEDCVGFCRRRRLKCSGLSGGGKQDMWLADSDLYMLRTIDELKNETSWTLSANGIPRTHPSYQVGLYGLMADGHHVEEGKGIVVASVRRLQSSRANTNGQQPSSDTLSPQAGNISTPLLPQAKWSNDILPSPYSKDATSTTETHHNSHPAKAAPRITIKQHPDSDEDLTFSNTINPPATHTQINNAFNSNLWPWLTDLPSQSRTEYRDVTDAPEDLELRPVRSLRHVKGRVSDGSVNRVRRDQRQQ